MNRDFKGIWIPKEIWLNPKISVQGKVLWAEIHSLYSSEHGGCYASDDYLCEFLGVKTSRLKEILKELRDNNFLKTVSFDGRTRVMQAVYPKLDDQVENEEDIEAGEQVAGKPASRHPENRLAEGRKTGFSHIYSNKEDNKEKKEVGTSANAAALFDFFLKKIKENNPSFKDPNQKTWTKELDLLLRIDKRDPEEVKRVIEWSRNAKWYKSNVLSPESLRKQYDKMWAAMQETAEDENVKKNRLYVMTAREKYPAELKNVVCKGNCVIFGSSGKDLSLDMEHELFKETFKHIVKTTYVG